MMWNRLLVIAAVVLVVGGIILALTTDFYTDWLWFEQIGYVSVFWTVFTWQWGVRLGFGLVFTVFLFFNLLVTRQAIRQALFRWQQQIEIPWFLHSRWIISVFLLVSVLLGFLYSSTVGTYWQTVVQFFHQTPFDTTDPIFHRNIAFYVFSLPFYDLLYTAFQALLTLILIAVAIVYFLTGAFVFADGRLILNPRAKVHLSLLVAGIFALKAAGYLLAMYRLVYSPRGVVFGASYTDVHAQVLALRVMSVIAIFVSLAIIINIFRRGIHWAVGSIALLVLASFVLGNIYPSLMQRYLVEPNELEKEEPYIRYNIEYTRKAFGLEDVEEREFQPESTLSPEKAAAYRVTLDNVRVWDWRPLVQTYSQLQEFRPYYDFSHVDTDRYVINGKYQQVMLAARELLAEQLQNRTWINERLQYTHGYGLAMSPVNRVTPEGLPHFLISNIPPDSKIEEIPVIERPEIYYGEQTDRYVFVKTKRPEFDYPKGDQNAEAFYQGTGGVPIGSLWRRLAFALRLGDIKILLSGSFTKESRIMFNRRIDQRVRKIAPFLKYDRDPYLVIADGRLYWIVDAYTTSRLYPYSQPVRGWGNYVRNSVKIVIDAYNGSVDFYIVDDEDPLVRTLQKIYPRLFRPFMAMPASLRAHIRYPEDFFRIQASVYATYHMDDPRVFYNREDLWSLPQELYAGERIDMDPYYTIMQLPDPGSTESPGQKEEEFVLLLPFTPARKNNMIAWLAARNDGEHYGEMILYKFPKQRLTYGPMQIEARIDQDADISRQLTLWNQRGSRVIRGNLLVIPIANSILYVEPIYLQAEESQLPELKRVVVALGSKVVMANTFREAFQAALGLEERPEVAPEPVPKAGAELPPQSTRELIQRALTLFERSQERLRAGDWSGYGETLAELEAVLRTLNERQIE